MTNERSSIGIGYLIIPDECERDKFLAQCFNKQKFCIVNNNGEFIENVPCLEQILNDLQFPIDSKSFGSQILYLNLPGQNVPIIIGTLAKQFISSYRKENDFIINKNFNDVDVGILGNLSLRKIIFSIKSVAKKFCKMIISVSGDEKSEMSIESSGYIFLKAKNGGIKIKGVDKEIIIDKEKILITNTSKQNIRIDDNGFDYKDGLSNKLKINKDGYILGNINFRDYINEILDFLGNDISLNTQMGPTAPGCSTTTAGAKLMELIQKIHNINND